jgi:hypothetical protein
MNPDGEHLDGVDILIKLGIFGGFVIVAVCFWVIKRERQRKQRTGNQEGKRDEQQ